MTFRGHVHNGVVVLDDPIQLPEGAEVRVETVAQEGRERRSVADRLRGVIGSAPDLPADLAENHDHYIHGTPKK